MDKDKQFFEYYIQTTTVISELRDKNNHIFFSISKTTITLNIISVITLLLNENWENNNKIFCMLFTFLIILTIFSMIVSRVWVKKNKLYSDINAAKFAVIDFYCKENEMYSFFQEEYKIYNDNYKLKDRKYSRKISSSENILIYIIPSINLILVAILLYYYFIK